MINHELSQGSSEQRCVLQGAGAERTGYLQGPHMARPEQPHNVEKPPVATALAALTALLTRAPLLLAQCVDFPGASAAGAAIESDGAVIPPVLAQIQAGRSASI